MPRRQVRTPIEQLQPFERGRIVGLRKQDRYRRITAHVGLSVSVMCRCFQQWSVKHSHTRIPCSGRLRSTDARQDRRIVRAAVTARTASRLKFIRTVCLQQDSDHVCFWSGYHLHQDTVKHSNSSVVIESTGEWNGALLSSVMRVGSALSEYWMYRCTA